MVSVNGDISGGDLRKKNAPIEVAVDVHPNRLAFDDGLLSLVFTVSVRASTGDRTLEDSVLETRSVRGRG